MKRSSRKRRMWLRTLALSSLLWMGLAPEVSPTSSVHEKNAHASSSARTAAYVFDRPNLSFSDRDAGHLNQLNFSFALIKNGKASDAHWQKIDEYKAFIQKHPHIQPVVSVGGWGADGFSQAAATARGRSTLVQSILDLMEKHGFTGVDIDWEYPCSSAAGIASSKDDRENFTLLLQELRNGLDALTARDGKPRLLACALGASPELVQNIDCPAVGKIVDQVNLMTYDIQTPNVVSHHTPLYSSPDYPNSVDNAVTIFSNAGIPRNKIMVGAAFYGRLYTIDQSTDSPLFTPALSDGYKARDYSRLQSMLASAKVHFDQNAKAPYALDETTFITYDDPVSIRYKGDYVNQNSLMGMMCWEYGGDDSGELLRAMYESMN